MTNKAEIAALNKRIELPAGVCIVEGNGGLPKVEIRTPIVEADIYLYGAQVTSWKPSDSREVLFVSEKSYWEEGRAIRGGIPVCFPWFRAKADDPKAPAHGFVRTKEWQVASIAEQDGEVCAHFFTMSDETTRQWWPFDFRLDYRITVGTCLSLELTMQDRGQSALRFEEALHTYFSVGDVEKVIVNGLDGASFLDNRDRNVQKKQLGGLRIGAQTDDAFLEVLGPVEIVDEILQRTLTTEKQGSASTIVWNPWGDGAASMVDLGVEEWRSMLCVEGGNILGAAVALEPQQAHSMRVKISQAAHS